QVGDAARPAAVAGEQLAVARDVVMHRPVLTGNRVTNALARFQVYARQPEFLRARRLQVVPDPLAVVREKLVARDLVAHGPLVHELELLAVGAHGPDTVHLMPGALVTKEQALGVGRRRLQVVEPFGRVVNLPGGPGLEVGDDQRQGPAAGPEPTGRFVARRQR